MAKRRNISNGDYNGRKHLGRGGQGDVFKVDDGAGQSYAMKKYKSTEDARKEYKILAGLHKHGSQKASFPKVYYFGHDKYEKSKYVIIMSLLGQDLHSIKRYRTLNTVEILMVAKQLILMIKDLHYLGYLHNDIKPNNIVAWKYRNMNHISLIDFGLAELYKDSEGKHRPMKKLSYFTGTYTYASANALRSFQKSRRDDMISIIYTLVDLKIGALPWRVMDVSRMVYQKEHISVSHLCKAMPQSIKYIANNIFSLRYLEKPKYEAYLREIERDIRTIKFRR